MKRSYHSDIIIQYKLGMLPGTVLKQIPSSTLDNWKKRDPAQLFGLEYIHDFQENFCMMKDFLDKKVLLKAAKSLYYIYRTYVHLLDTVKNKKKVLRESKQVILQTIDQVKSALGLKRSIQAFGISYQQFYAWKRTKKCPVMTNSFCRKTYHNQLTVKEVDSIRAYLEKPQYKHWSITSVYYQILRDKAAFFSKTSFYKYVNQLQLQRSRPERKKYTEGIRSDRPKRILHMDVTIYKPLDHTRVYLYFLVDNYSRFILSWKASLKYAAAITFENITEAIGRYNLTGFNPGIDLICDGGSENKGPVDTFSSNPENNITKLVAQSDIRFSNSMVEAVNKRMKYDFLYRTRLLNIEQVQQYLNIAIEQYNNKPHTALYGLTPKEVFNGRVPDKDMFKAAIQQAAGKRKVINMNQECLNCI